MRPGTPAFVGARLKEAREARGLTANSFAELVGVSRQAVSQYERGCVTPHPEVMGRITSVMNLPHEFFWQPARSAPEKVFFGPVGAAVKTARIRESWRLQWLMDICCYLQEFVEFPTVNIPEYHLPGNLENIERDLIEDLAGKVRRYWGLGSGVIVNMVRLLEKNGVIVALDQVGSGHSDTFSDWENGKRPCVVLGSGSAAKLRFDAGHQLGHIILHRKIDKSIMNRPEEFKLADDQARYFAGVFLLPGEELARDCSAVSLESMRLLKAKWKLPVEMMINRSIEIGLCPEERVQQLWKSYSRRGWKGNEPLDDELQVEEPQLLSQSFELIIEDKVKTRDEILNSIHIARTDIEDLAGLPAGYLEAEPLMIKVRR